MSGEPREKVVELRELHLKLAFAGARAAGEDVQDELRAVQHFAREGFVEVAELGRRQVAVEQNRVGLEGLGLLGQFADFARAD